MQLSGERFGQVLGSTNKPSSAVKFNWFYHKHSTTTETTSILGYGGLEIFIMKAVGFD